MANTPGNAPPSVNQLDAFMQAREPMGADRAKFGQDPQAAAVMAWLQPVVIATWFSTTRPP